MPGDRTVLLGGGIAPKILGKLQTGAFQKAYANKGRLAPNLNDIPIQIILNDKTALLGAAYWGASTLD